MKHTSTRIEQKDAVLGVLHGTMIGDSLGLPREGLSRRRSHALFGRNIKHALLPFQRGMISDDSEHALMVLHAFLECKELSDSEFRRRLAHRLRWWILSLPPGTGRATLIACTRLCIGISPEHSGVHSAGNGGAMRAPILGVLLADEPVEFLFRMIDVSTKITHTDPRALLGARAVGLAARLAVQVERTDELYDTFKNELMAIIPTNDGEAMQWSELVFKHSVGEWKPEEFLTSLKCAKGVSGYIYHTVPAVLVCWLRSPDDFRECIERVIDLGGDADTTAAILGGICGARVGCEGVPKEWVDAIFDYPLSVNFASRLSAATSQINPESDHALPRWPLLPIFMLRNLLFLIVVFLHIIRRMLPPY